MPNPILDEERLERAAQEITKAELAWKAANGGDAVSCTECPDDIKARAAISAYLGETHVVVPREPTSEQLDAMLRAGQSVGFHWSVNVIDKLRAVYRSTLSSPDKIGEDAGGAG